MKTYTGTIKVEVSETNSPNKLFIKSDCPALSGLLMNGVVNKDEFLKIFKEAPTGVIVDEGLRQELKDMREVAYHPV
jgi:hypothetical protein